MNKLPVLLITLSNLVFAQNFTKADTLKGSNTEFRNFWDVKKYEISVKADSEKKHVSGTNLIRFEIIKDVKNPIFQIDLQQPMDYKIVSSNVKGYLAERNEDFIFIKTKRNFKKGEKGFFTIEYFGTPIVAKNAPWDGGWVFKKDNKNRPFVAVAQEGIGASSWLPIKDIWSDEPDDGVILKISTEDDKVGVGNGRLISKQKEKDSTTYTWEVKSPINPYSIAPSIGNYVNFKDTYLGEKGILDLEYWVLDYNLEKAKKQFQQVKPMMKAFEKWFGPYPFYKDSYKIVEVPFLGMEHQSNVAYGNQYMNGYLGQDNSGTGKGLGWDFIIIHESGHEWFANNITAKDQADMWIHEAFTTYSEVIFVEETMDKTSADIYLQGLRNNILNDKPVIGSYGVRNEGSYDMYYKGANLLHTIRTVMNNDEKFRQILRGLNKDFYHQTVTTQQIENYINKKSGIDFSTVFNQYLRTVKVPTLEYIQNGKQLKFRYKNIVKGLKLPIRITSNQTINPTEDWQTVTLQDGNPIQFNENYYINFEKVIL